MRVWDTSRGVELSRIRYDGAAHTLAFTPNGNRILLASRNWAHLFDVSPTLAPHASRQLDAWTGTFHFMDPCGDRLSALTWPVHGNFRIETVDFTPSSDAPIPGRLPRLSQMEARLALRFEGEELVPTAMARLVRPQEGLLKVAPAKSLEDTAELL
jgi:hypothetical protein